MDFKLFVICNNLACCIYLARAQYSIFERILTPDKTCLPISTSGSNDIRSSYLRVINMLFKLCKADVLIETSHLVGRINQLTLVSI